jgi:uncharacterized protein (TIRG00374 family)
VENFYNAWDTLLKGGWHRPTWGAALNVGFDMLTLYFLFVAAGRPVSPGVLMAGYGLPLLFSKVWFFIPGGVGVIEGSMTALFSSLGVSTSVTVVVVLAYPMISFWLPTLLGFPISFMIQRLPGADDKK